MTLYVSELIQTSNKKYELRYRKATRAEIIAAYRGSDYDDEREDCIADIKALVVALEDAAREASDEQA